MEQSAEIQFVDVTHLYGEGASTVEALHDLNLSIEAGEFVALMGPSGCGKTTLLNLAGGMDLPTSGSILVNGEAINEYSDQKLTEYRRDGVGFVFQFFNLLPTLSVLENVELPMHLADRNGSAVTNRAKEMLERVGMSERLTHYPYQLSGGEMQRAAIARALSHQPQLVLADEPTGNLDSANGERVLELLRDLSRQQNLTVLMATHSREAAEYAGRTVVLMDGRVSNQQ